MLEAYQAYTDYLGIMNTTQGAIEQAVRDEPTEVVGDEKEQQYSDTQPDGAARQRPQKEPERSPRRPGVQTAGTLHSSAQEHVPCRVERDRQRQQEVCFGSGAP